MHHDGRPRGSGHAGWLKMQKKSKYIRGEAVKKVSKMGASILRDHARSEGTTMQLQPRGISTQPELTHDTENESNSYQFFHAEKVCELLNLAYYQHLLTSPNCPTCLEFDYTRGQQVGVCWTEILKYFFCHIRSEQKQTCTRRQAMEKEEKSLPNPTLPYGQP